MDRLTAMSIFVTSVDLGSFSAAGRKLDIPLPTVSRNVSDLEAYLKARLLTRSSRKLSLTDAGAHYVSACRKILELVGDAERTAGGEWVAPRGDLVLAAPVAFGRLHMLPIVNEFLTEYPEINVQLLLSDRNASLADDHVDLALRIGHLPDSGLIAKRVGAVKRVVCASPAFLARYGEPSTPEELIDYPCISFAGLASGPAWTFPSIDGKGTRSVPISLRLVVNTSEAAVDAAVAGVGFTHVLCYQTARAVREGTLMTVLREFEPDPMPVNLLHVPQGTLPIKMRVFMDFAVPRLKRALTPKTLGAGTVGMAPEEMAS